MNYFIGTAEQPYHLSVGAVLVNEKGDVCCHYFKKAPIGDAEDIYVLMRESMNQDETIEQALARGLKEEFNAEARIRHFLGSIVSHFPRDGKDINKTTLFFLCDLQSQDIASRNRKDEEGMSEIQWRQPDFLIQKMRVQGKRYPEETSLDESDILMRAKTQLI